MSQFLERDGFPTWYDVEANNPGWFDATLIDALAAADTQLKPWQLQASMGALVAQ